MTLLICEQCGKEIRGTSLKFVLSKLKQHIFWRHTLEITEMEKEVSKNDRSNGNRPTKGIIKKARS